MWRVAFSGRNWIQGPRNSKTTNLEQRLSSYRRAAGTILEHSSSKKKQPCDGKRAFATRKMPSNIACCYKFITPESQILPAWIGGSLLRVLLSDDLWSTSSRKQTRVRTVCKSSNRFKQQFKHKTHKLKMAKQFNWISHRNNQNNRKNSNELYSRRYFWNEGGPTTPGPNNYPVSPPS